MGDAPEFRRILVPVDFQDAADDVVEAGKAVKVGNHFIDFAPASLRSIQIASRIARGGGEGNQILLVHATPTLAYSSMYTGTAGVSLPTRIVDEINDRAKATSMELLEMLAREHAPDAEVELVARPGVALDVIKEEAARFDADLIVMAASGRSRVARFFVGSTADRIIRTAECPVLVVPARPH